MQTSNQPEAISGPVRVRYASVAADLSGAACERAEVEPHFVILPDDADVHALIIGKNSHRRHMPTGARAMATALTLADAGLRENGRWKRGALAIGRSSDSAWAKAMHQAGEIIDHDEVLAAQVAHGETALDAAYKQVRDEQAEAERQRRSLRDESNDSPESESPTALDPQVRPGGQMLDGTKPGPKGDAVTLTAIGISHNDSSRWQRIAAIPEDEFEEFIAAVHEKAASARD